MKPTQTSTTFKRFCKPLFIPSMIMLSAISTQTLSARECLLDGNSTGGATSGSPTALGCGPGASAGGDYSTALGRAAISAGFASTALGFSASSAGSYSIALALSASSTGNNSTALGYFANSDGDNSTALGRAARSAGSGSNALGHFASSAGISSTALGHSARSAGIGSTALGFRASSAGNASTALGHSARSAGNYSTALGFRAKVDLTAHYGIAIGGDTDGDLIGAQSLAVGAIALGADVVNDIPNSMKIGVPLRIQGDVGEAGLLVEEADPTVLHRFQLELKNNGSTGFLLSNTSITSPTATGYSQWQFASQSNEAFTASFIGTGGPEMQIRKDGAVQFGPGNVVNFALSSNGYLTLPNGAVTATAHITSSSRTVKQDFKKVSPSDILKKLEKLEITEWRYKNKDAKGRHIGPMAEDFYKLFKLGEDNKHVVGTDMASIAIVAAKELHERDAEFQKKDEEFQKKIAASNAETKALKSETASLKTENEKLKQRLTSLEKLVTNLVASSKILNSSGDKVALK